MAARRSLRARVVSIFLVVFGLLTPIIATLLVLGMLSSLTATLEGRAALVAEALSSSLELSVAAKEGNAEAAAASLGWVAELDEELVRVVVLRPGGAPLVGRSAEGVLPVERLAEAPLEASFFLATVEREIRPPGSGRPEPAVSDLEAALAADAAALEGEDEDGSAERARPRVRVTLSARAEVLQQLSNVLLTSLLLCVASLLALRAVLRGLVRHVSPALDQARRMAQGDFVARGGTEYEELAPLFDAFNAISASLSTMLQDVRGLADDVSVAIERIHDESSGIRKGVSAELSAVEDTGRATRALKEGLGRTGARLRELVAQAAASSQDTGIIASTNDKSARALSALSGQMERQLRSVDVLSERSTSLFRNAHVLGESSAQARAAATRMQAKVEETAGQAADAAKLAAAAMDASLLGGRAIEDAMLRITDIAERAHAMERRLDDLAARVEGMRPVLQSIGDVTASTSLLALNAGILAAQAGEHGRPFQVVVEQLRALAGQTTQLTSEVELAVGTVLEERLRTSEVAVELGRIVQASIDDAKRAGGALAAIRESTAESGAVSASIAETMRAQVQEVEETLARIQESAGAGGAVEGAASSLVEETRVLREVSAEVQSVMVEVVASSAEQRRLAERVGVALGKVSAEVKELGAQQARQEGDAARVDGSMRRIEQVAEDARARAAQLEAVVAGLRANADELIDGLSRFHTPEGEP